VNCRVFEQSVHPYVDGELGVSETLAADAHAAECARCRDLAERERHFRQLLRRQPRESVPPELRAAVVARLRRAGRLQTLGRWALAPVAGAAAAAIAVAVLSGGRPTTPETVGVLVDKHIAFAQMERPAEVVATSPAVLHAWFRERAGLQVTVPDYSPAGIRLLGGRVADLGPRRAAYILYEKGHTLLSVFVAPDPDGAPLPGRRLAYRGHDYVTSEQKGYRTVAWADGDAVFGLVSMLDYDALLECADRLRAERAARTRLQS
jgi:anti-sigma factor (TIGR02949 family)